MPTSIHSYHFDGLGSVIALTNSSGSVVNLYEYSVYGEVSASDPNHPNRFLFTGREFDKDTGLYYYRARYYNPYLGRFLQTDPIGYEDGMNVYGYCGNNPIGMIDPFGAKTAPVRYVFRDAGTDYYESEIALYRIDGGTETLIGHWQYIGVFLGQMLADPETVETLFGKGWEESQVGWKLAGQGNNVSREGNDQRWWFWQLKALEWLDGTGGRSRNSLTA